MPELPEVETVKRAMAPLVGRTLLRSQAQLSRLRLPIPRLTTLTGKKLQEVRRRGKYLIFNFGTSGCLVIHLGMTGYLRVSPTDEPPMPHEHVRFWFDQGLSLRFTDPRRFGSVQLFRQTKQRKPLKADQSQASFVDHPLFADLGPEPLADDFTPEVLWALLQKSAKPVKNLLLDQSVVAGLGNIYVAEALFKAKVHPQTPAAELSRSKARRLHGAIQEVLRHAIDCGSTLLGKAFHHAEPVTKFPLTLMVYDREGEPCKRCRQAKILCIRLAGRSTFFCPHCQPRGASFPA